MMSFYMIQLLTHSFWLLNLKAFEIINGLQRTLDITCLQSSLPRSQSKHMIGKNWFAKHMTTFWNFPHNFQIQMEVVYMNLKFLSR